jgi:Zn-dependent membrane protease YugP
MALRAVRWVRAKQQECDKMDLVPLFIFTFDPLYWILVGPTILIALWAQMQVTTAFAKYKKVGNRAGLSGAEAAARMLQGQGIAVVPSAEQAKAMDNAVAIVPTQGMLSDHYDPRAKVLRLSREVYEGRSLASVGVACHEAGHALQDARGYAPLELRNVMVPMASFGSNFAWIVIIAGLILQGIPALLTVGILLFTAVVLFQIVTLPVEFNASTRAKEALSDLGIIQGPGEAAGVAKVLNAAAMTYVAAVISSVMTLIYFLMIASRR